MQIYLIVQGSHGMSLRLVSENLQYIICFFVIASWVYVGDCRDPTRVFVSFFVFVAPWKIFGNLASLISQFTVALSPHICLIIKFGADMGFFNPLPSSATLKAVASHTSHHTRRRLLVSSLIVSCECHLPWWRTMQ